MIAYVDKLRIPFRNVQCKTALVACAGLSVAYGAAQVYNKWKKRSTFIARCKQIRDKEQAYIQQTLDELQDEDEDEREEILAMSAQEIIAAAQTGKISPVKIVKAYLYQGSKSTLRTNSITALLPNAVNDAKRLEKIKNPADYPLFGLPISVKENLDIKGLSTTYGVVLDHPCKDDCNLIKVLKSQGAIPYARTNFPQTLYSFGNNNPVFGEVRNPHNLDFAPGGSSSGEGSLVGDGGSILGIGNDIAGSVRAPSHLCGIAGLKPGSNRWSLMGVHGPQEGIVGVIPSSGPMSKTVDGLVLAMKATLCPLMFELDPYVAPMPFNEEVFSSTEPLRIGYYVDNGYIKPIPVIQRAVLQAKKALEKAGHTLVPFEFPNMEEAMRLNMHLLNADGGIEIVNKLKDIEVTSAIKQYHSYLSCPPVIKQIKGFFLNWMYPRIGKMFSIVAGGPIGAVKLCELICDLHKFQDEFYAAWETEAGSLDAIICPPYSLVACPPENLLYMPEMMSYLAPYVMLDCPAGVVPVTKTTQADCDALKNYKGHYGDPWDDRVKNACKDSIGMPSGVQCVTKPWQDELCLRVMKEVENGVNYRF